VVRGAPAVGGILEAAWAAGKDPLDSVFAANIARFKELLAVETDTRTIAALRKLLIEQEVKRAVWLAS
jgi:hypothetical protein